MDTNSNRKERRRGSEGKRKLRIQKRRRWVNDWVENGESSLRGQIQRKERDGEEIALQMGDHRRRDEGNRWNQEGGGGGGRRPMFLRPSQFNLLYNMAFYGPQCGERHFVIENLQKNRNYNIELIEHVGRHFGVWVSFVNGKDLIDPSKSWLYCRWRCGSSPYWSSCIRRERRTIGKWRSRRRNSHLQ